jgi:hypothetical protein
MFRSQVPTPLDHAAPLRNISNEHILHFKLVSDNTSQVVDVPVDILEYMVFDKKQIDNMLILSAKGCDDDGVPQFLKRYRNMVNANLLFVDVMLMPPRYHSG